jgi:hypothetical protein
LEEIGKILPAVFRAQVRRAEPALLEILVPLWPRVVGRGIAQQTRPVAFAAGRLTLATSCPTWAAQLRHLAEEIRARINNYLGSPIVRKLCVEHRPQMESAERPMPRNSPLDFEALKLPALELTDKLDPEIAGILERSFAKYFARRGRKVH